MTGFARRELATAWGVLACELRSVNHRYLEVQLRLPEALRHTEHSARELLREQLGRGKVDCTLRLHAAAGERGLQLNEALLRQLIDACARAETLAGNLARTDALELLRWPGVIADEVADADALGAAALELIAATTAELAGMRTREGEGLGAHIEQRLARISELVAQVRANLPATIAAHHQRLRTRLAELLAQPPAERFEQEIALLATRADVAEELDRLEVHVAETRRSLRQGGACGRRLDFLMQEFNREANTLSSKSLATDTTQAAIEMKVLIEQMREQVQNIE
jgi:uncharacterized protein (TIGR00255 family)